MKILRLLGVSLPLFLVASCATAPRPIPVASLGAPEPAAAEPPPPVALARFQPGPAAGRELAEADPTDFFKRLPVAADRRHVHYMHLDGFRPDLFNALLEAGQLPHFLFLLQRAKISLKTSTVDKSETMKVIESYLTSRRDTSVVGWWQFSRDSFQFRNFWLDPVEVVNYAIGLEFPLYPTVFDFLAAKGRPVASGFGLHRRSVPFANYSRAYVAGGTAAFKHTYFDQVNATMDGVVKLYERVGRNHEPVPALSTSLLATADEYAHYFGVIRTPAGTADPSQFCFTRKSKKDERKKDRLERIFATVDAEGDRLKGLLLQETRDGKPQGYGYFTRIRRERRGLLGPKEAVELCVRLPKIEANADHHEGGPDTLGPARTEYAEPFYVLGMIMIDYQLSRLIDAMRSVRFDAKGSTYLEPKTEKGILPYLRGRKGENSVFENTLFVFQGDHGMIDSKNKMVAADPKHPDPDRLPRSLNTTFIESLNPVLGLETSAKDKTVSAQSELGLDDALIPARLAFPHKDKAWQSPEIRAITAGAERWAEEFFQELKGGIKQSLYHEYWYLLFFRHLVIDPKIQNAVRPYEPMAKDILAQLYLKGEPAYQAAERAANRAFYDEHVRLVYGGGARNNAEFFLPTSRGGRLSWTTRPTFDEIMNYRAGSRSQSTLIDALKSNPGVALIFVRKSNAALVTGATLPQRMEILVVDSRGNRGLISVERDASTQELVYGYRVEPDSKTDPLGYADTKPGEWSRGTYNEWNDHSTQKGHYYHNAVAGMGSFLYSTNPSIGDITVMNSQGWNFGDNSGGHGGLHREEKVTMTLVSGPGIEKGALTSTAKYRSTADGAGVAESPYSTYPTVVDAAPSLLKWLGYGDDALESFARKGFEAHLGAWIDSQKASCADDAVVLIDESMRAAKLDLDLSDDLKGKLRTRFKRLCRGLAQSAPKLPDYSGHRIDGNTLNF